MHATDSQKFAALMTEIAECYDRKPPTPAAMKNWFDALMPFPWIRVESSIREWILTKSKFPTIAEIVQPLNERTIDECESRWNQQKQKERRDVEAFASNEKVVEVISALKGIMKTTDPKAWARKILDAYANGGEVEYFALKLACEAIHMDFHSLMNSKRSSQSVRST